jgi:hypothetical protein
MVSGAHQRMWSLILAAAGGKSLVHARLSEFSKHKTLELEFSCAAAHRVDLTPENAPAGPVPELSPGFTGSAGCRRPAAAGSPSEFLLR